jgi:DNA replication licensing factor MCM3
VRIKVEIEGPIGATAHSPRGLTSSLLRQLVCVEGVATKVSTVKPKIVQSVHYCPATDKHEQRDYVDATHMHLGLSVIDKQDREQPDQIINMTTTIYPTQDADKNPLETEFGLSRFKDHQTIVLQEMPEKAPMGQLPRSVDLVLDDDLVDTVKPGDRIQVVGIFRALGSRGNTSHPGTFKSLILVNNIRILGRDINPVALSDRDKQNIKKISQKKDILQILGRSVAPSIHGHDIIKRALALQLLSGCEKNLINGTHLRGDINILMVGDPSTAKSQLLRSAMMLAPLAVSTTGKGSSGVGLTAAVTSDSDTRERRLEAGAMVLADRGIVCIDEFDKMSESDRVAIHEAMEQQTVTIAKAGIHASLNARCSVLAAANPVYGQYDRSRRIQENIGLPDSLLSRFDLLFVILDQLDPESDRRIANHVMKGHQYKASNRAQFNDSDNDDDDDDMEEEASSSSVIWQRSTYCGPSFSNSYLHRITDDEDDESDSSDNILHHEFLRKYLHYAKTNCKPILTEEARESIASRYAEIRSRQDDRTLPITARSLETIIRLATAHAKARLSPIVESVPDCSVAMDILAYALYHESYDPNKKQKLDESSSSSASSSEIPSGYLVLDDIISKVWQALSYHGVSDISIVDVCPDVVDRDIVLQALNRMEQDGRIMIDNGSVCVI